MQHIALLIGFITGTLTAQSPPVRITAPAAGKTVLVGDTLTIRWEVDFNAIASPLVIDISPDNGANYAAISPEGIAHDSSKIYAGNIGTLQWVVTPGMQNEYFEMMSLVSDSCHLRFNSPYDSVSDYYYSPGLFHVQARSASLHSNRPAFALRSGRPASSPGVYSMLGRRIRKNDLAAHHLFWFADEKRLRINHVTPPQPGGWHVKP
ncbi:MAG: hypothetical protein GF398_00405 [Chitinivibrionales bacterium]|nr:hypothetical protein [Chitinivibrionales bacterium]